MMILLKQNAFVDAKDNNGMTPLHSAAMRKEKDVAEAILNKKIIERLINFNSAVNA